MSVVAGEDSVRMEDASRLASYLRMHPDAQDEPAEELAERFGLPVEFVASVIHSLDYRPTAAPLQPAIRGLKRALYQCRLLFRRLTHDPLVFIVATTAAAIALFLVIESVLGRGLLRPEGSPGPFSVQKFAESGAVFLSIAFVTLALHQACYFRHGKVRHALLGAVWAWVISASTVMVLGWLSQRRPEDALTAVQLLLMAYVMFVLCVMYAMVSTVTSVLGGVYWVRKHEEAKERRSRQELLEHWFDLQRRLEAPQPVFEPEEPEFWRYWTHRLQPLFLPVALVGGVLYSLVHVSITLALGAAFGDGFESTPLGVMTELTFGFVNIFAMSVCAYIGRRIDRAMVAALVFQYATIPFTLVPLGPYGPHLVRTLISPNSLFVTIGSALVVGSIASLGAKVEARHAIEKRLRQNEKAALLAELVKTERQLALQTLDVCVLVVDVAASSKMKSRANPLEVEYSFREYQRYVATTCERFGGIVHSTAGDGAIVAFYDCVQAFDAARRLQTDLAEFNGSRNKLKAPFRIRIGLHLGQVAGDLGDVQFSEVIDIAAHVEAAAPIGGIALTHAVAEQLPQARLAQLPDKISGQLAYVAVQPVEEA